MGRRNQGNKPDPEEASPEKAAVGWRAGVASGRPGRQVQALAAVRRVVARLPSAWASGVGKWATGGGEASFCCLLATGGLGLGIQEVR